MAASVHETKQGGARIPRAATATPASRQCKEPTTEEIQNRAYERFQARNSAGTYGNAALDWALAEKELREECGA